ncbi:MAG: hypothetical protein JNK74_10030 [Candidatus Hydrogenedentes bacterium]|nr:hypothetical protein [Candidatus Hydrogenedentota bacterium]
MSKELNLICEQVARRCADLELEGRAIVVGVNGPDGAVNAAVAKGLKTHLAGAGRDVAAFHLENCADAEVRQRILGALKGGVTPELVQQYGEESIDFALARRTLQELAEGGDIVVADGTFLYTGALADIFDLRVYLDVAPDVLAGRMATGAKAEGLEALAAPGFAHYFAEYGPMTGADLVVDVNDPRKPRVVTAVD